MSLDLALGILGHISGMRIDVFLKVVSHLDAEFWSGVSMHRCTDVGVRSGGDI